MDDEVRCHHCMGYLHTIDDQLLLRQILPFYTFLLLELAFSSKTIILFTLQAVSALVLLHLPARACAASHKHWFGYRLL